MESVQAKPLFSTRALCALILPLMVEQLLAVTVGMSMAYNGLVDAFTLMRFFMDLGGGKFTQGLLVGFGVYALTVVVLLVGMAFLSWRRHGDARQLPGSTVRGHRLRLLAANLAGALTYVPFLVAVALIGRGYVSQLVAAISGLATGSVTLPPLTDNLYLVGIAFLVLLCPLLPLKALIPAAAFQIPQNAGRFHALFPGYPLRFPAERVNERPDVKFRKLLLQKQKLSLVKMIVVQNPAGGRFHDQCAVVQNDGKILPQSPTSLRRRIEGTRRRVCKVESLRIDHSVEVEQTVF